MKQGKITVDTTGGWASDFSKGAASAPATRQGSYFTGLFNANKPNYLGQIANAFKEDTSQVTADELPINGTSDSSNNGFFILKNGGLPKVNITAANPSITLNYTAPAGATTDLYKDIWTHVTTAGVEAILYTYQTATTAYLGIASLPLFTRTDTYQTFTNLNKPHVGVVSVSNKSYITDGNLVRVYDPNSGSPFAQSLNVGLGWTTVSVEDYGNYVAIVGNRGNSARMWLWDGSASVPNFQYDIRDTVVTAIINEGGDLRVFTYGKNATTKIKTFNGSGFSEEADWETPTTLCPAPAHNMRDVWLNQIVWRTPDGYVWTYGSPRKNEINTGANRCGLLTTDTNSYGCVKNLYGDRLYFGITSASGTNTNKLYLVNPTSYYEIGGNTSNVVSALYALPHKSTVTQMNIYFGYYVPSSTGSSASSATVSFYKDYTTTDLMNYPVPLNNVAGQNVYFHPVKLNVQDVDSFYFKIAFSLAIIRKIEIFYTYDDVAV